MQDFTKPSNLVHDEKKKRIHNFRRQSRQNSRTHSVIRTYIPHHVTQGNYLKGRLFTELRFQIPSAPIRSSLNQKSQHVNLKVSPSLTSLTPDSRAKSQKMTEAKSTEISPPRDSYCCQRMWCYCCCQYLFVPHCCPYRRRPC